MNSTPEAIAGQVNTTFAMIQKQNNEGAELLNDGQYELAAETLSTTLAALKDILDGPISPQQQNHDSALVTPEVVLRDFVAGDPVQCDLQQDPRQITAKSNRDPPSSPTISMNGRTGQNDDGSVERSQTSDAKRPFEPHICCRPFLVTFDEPKDDYTLIMCSCTVIFNLALAVQLSASDCEEGLEKARKLYVLGLEVMVQNGGSNTLVQANIPLFLSNLNNLVVVYMALNNVEGASRASECLLSTIRLLLDQGHCLEGSDLDLIIQNAHFAIGTFKGSIARAA